MLTVCPGLYVKVASSEIGATSFINYLHRKLKPDLFWVNTGSVDIYDKILEKINFNSVEDLVKLAKGEMINKSITKNCT